MHGAGHRVSCLPLCHCACNRLGKRAADALLIRVQVVTDEMWATRAARWPDQPPATREYFLLRSIFEEHFPSPSALATVPTVRPLAS